MDTYTKQHTDLHQAVQSVHAMFRRWDANNVPSAPLLFQKHPQLLHKAQLALHEWLANLSQHADFKDRVPSILISVTACDSKFTCSIRDNSEGFVVEDHFTEHEDIFSLFPERGMGLELIKHCTSRINYETIDSGVNLFTFTITASQDDV